MDFNALRKKYPGYADEEILGALQAVSYPDYSITEIANAVGYKPQSRSLWAVANDTVIQGANAAAGAVGAAADFIAPGNRVSKFIDESIVRPGEEAQSDAAKWSRRQFQEEVQAADGIGGELMAVGRKVVRDPLLTAAEAAGSFVVPGLAVKAAGGVAGALIPTALKTAAAAGDVAAAAQIAQITSRAGLAGGATAGMALAGGDAAGTAYDLVIKAGGSEQEAVAAARQASVIPAAIGGIGGVVGAERLLAGAGGVKGGIFARALKTGAVEGLQEGIEEGVTQFEGQRAAVPFDPTIDPMKGVGAAAGMGAIMGGAIGVASGALSRDVAANTLATTTDVGAMVAAAETLAMAPLTNLDEGRALDRLDQLRSEDEKAAKVFGTAPVSDQERAVNSAAMAAAVNNGQASATLADMPQADRTLVLQEQLADPATRQAIREKLGDQALDDALYYAGISDRPDGTLDAPVPEKTRERMLSLAEAIVSRAVLTPIDRPGMGGPAEVPGIGMNPAQQRITLDTGPTGNIRVDSAGNAAQETRADAINAAQPRNRPDGMTGQTPKGEQARRPAPPVNMPPRTARQASDPAAKDMTDADLVRATVDQFRRTNTPQARAFVGQYDSGRITDDDVLALLGRPPKSPDQRIAEAAAQAPSIQPGDLLTADGFPYGSKSAATVRATKEGGKVIEVPGGYAVRKEPQSAQPDVPVPAVVDRGAVGSQGVQPGGSIGTVGRVADAGGAGQVRTGEPAPADGGAEAQPVPGRGTGDGEALTDIPTLKKQWGEATAAGDTERAKTLNDRIVAMKARAKDAGATNASAPTEQRPKALDADSVPGKRIRNEALADAELLGRITRAQPAGNKLLGSLDAETKGLVLAGVGRLVKNREILKRIVELVPVDVMNILAGDGVKADGRAKYEAVLKNLAAIESESPIPVLVDAADTFVRVAARAAAEQVAMPDSEGTFPLARDAAVGAIEGDGLSAKRSGSASRVAEGGAGRISVDFRVLPPEGGRAVGTLDDRQVNSPTRIDELGPSSDATNDGPPTVSKNSRYAKPPATSAAAPVTPQAQAGTPAEGAGDPRPAPAVPTQAAASPNSAEAKPNSATPAPKPDKPKRPPKSFRSKQMVTTTVLVEETGKFEKREIDAETAMVALDADINELENFIKCLRG